MPDPYRQLVSDLQRPTEQQTAAFVKFVAGAHSWYKHLPQLAPGSPFIFFLNPDAGKQCIGTQTGETAFVDRVEGDGSEFHYTWMPTATYREKFGDWDYHSGMARTFMVGTPGGAERILLANSLSFTRRRMDALVR